MVSEEKARNIEVNTLSYSSRKTLSFDKTPWDGYSKDLKCRLYYDTSEIQISFYRTLHWLVCHFVYFIGRDTLISFILNI